MRLAVILARGGSKRIPRKNIKFFYGRGGRRIMRLAVIPARGGSKRIPKKNSRQFCGKPMMAWAIECAIQSECFDRIVVSTDDAAIASIGRGLGVDVPFVRPSDLSGDYTATLPVIAHAINELTPTMAALRYVCCIYPTAAFLTPDDLKRGLSSIEHSGSDFALGVTSYSSPIQRAFRVTSLGRLDMFQPEYFSARSQDLEPAYHDAGQFCWGRTEAWLDGRSVYSGGTVPVVLPRNRVQDIDSEEDWARAELMFHALQAKNGS